MEVLAGRAWDFLSLLLLLLLLARYAMKRCPWLIRARSSGRRRLEEAPSVCALWAAGRRRPAVLVLGPRAAASTPRPLSGEKELVRSELERRWRPVLFPPPPAVPAAVASS